MGWECFCVVGFDLGPLLQGGTRILHLQYFFKYVFIYFLHFTVTLLLSFVIPFAGHNFCPFLLSALEFLSYMLFNYHLLYFSTALSLIIMLFSHYHHKSKTLSQLTQILELAGYFLYTGVPPYHGYCLQVPFLHFYPTALKGCRGIVFTHGVRMGRRAVGRNLSGLYLRNHKV